VTEKSRGDTGTLSESGTVEADGSSFLKIAPELPTERQVS
jgi:hypothetical protein